MTTPAPSAQEVAQAHRNADRDASRDAMHHTIGPTETQAASGAHLHDGRDTRKLPGYIEKQSPPPTVTGSRGGNLALTSLLTVLAQQGIITNGTTA